MKKQRKLFWFNDLTVEHNPDNFEWEVYDKQRSEIIATFNDDYFSEATVWNMILKTISKKINKNRRPAVSGKGK